jgi:UDP-N-acetylmuramyl-tripeptide synthetase
MATGSTVTVPVLADLDAAVLWLRSCGVQSLVADSRRVRPGDAFIAWPGFGADARRFVPAALAAGAAACLVDAQGVAEFGFDGKVVAAVPDLKVRAGELASLFWGHPSEGLSVLAVTGTNGKTSCAWWMAQALSLLGRRCGLVGTLGVGEPPSVASPHAQLQSTGLTTPDPITLHKAFHHFSENGFSACAIEASSIGLVENRLAGTQVDVAVFTNFTPDHLDFHGTMVEYWQAKTMLFDWLGLRASVINVDDEQGAGLAHQLGVRGADVWSFSASAKPGARLQATDVRYDNGGLAFTVCEGALTESVQSCLIGHYNVSNLLAVLGSLRALGIPLVDAAAMCAQLTPVPGRMQSVMADEFVVALPSVVVDYAHTPDALEKALQALRPFAQAQGGALWVVFGCGGNRDAAKRPVMADIAQRHCEHVVLTCDNPRFESAQEILAQMQKGLLSDKNVVVMEDRRAAIAHAVAQAQASDVVLIAGKGHETEQDIAGVKHPFSDVLEAKVALSKRNQT